MKNSQKIFIFENAKQTRNNLKNIFHKVKQTQKKEKKKESKKRTVVSSMVLVGFILRPGMNK